MNHTVKELKNQIESKMIHPIYVLWGTEILLQNKSLELITNAVISSPEHKDFNYNIFYAKEHSARQIKECLETLPVLCNRRLVVCHDIHLFKEAEWHILQPLLEKPIESSVWVLLCPQLDRRKKMIKFLLSHSWVVKNQLDSSSDVIRWVQWLARQHHLQIHKESLDLLIKQAGPSLIGINHELKKLKSFLGSRFLVTERDILEVVSRVRPENIFSFTEAIGKRDLNQSFQLLLNLLEDQENEISLLALVFRHIRILSQLIDGVDRGLRGSELSTKAGIPSFFLRDYMKQIPLWNRKKLAQVTEILYATDKALKSSPISSHIWLENFVIKACSI